jgi:8-oxo-dGTP pyrophosphatase MutT (NUDIX family)
MSKKENLKVAEYVKLTAEKYWYLSRVQRATREFFKKHHGQDILFDESLATAIARIRIEKPLLWSVLSADAQVIRIRDIGQKAGELASMDPHFRELPDEERVKRSEEALINEFWEVSKKVPRELQLLEGVLLVNKERFPKREGVQQATLLFLIDRTGGEVKVLLAMKKRGFGKGHWNGVGGKVGKGELVHEAAVRETREEVGVTPESISKVGILHFYFPDDLEKEGWNQDVHVFFTENWKGEIGETEEMRPQWFNIDEIPYRDMWDDDIYWLPKALSGRKIRGKFEFNGDNKAAAYLLEDYVEEG